MRRFAALVLAIVASATTARADTLKLANGDTLTGKIVEWNVTSVVIEHPQLGRIELGLDQLDIETGEQPNKGLFGSNFLRGWTRRFDLGWNGKWGNTNSINITSALDMNYEDDFKRWRFNGRYFFNRTDDGDADNNARIDLRRDWLFPGTRWFIAAAARYQFDQFESWKNRTTLSLGPGLNLYRSETHVLDTLVGAAWTKEYGGSKSSKGEALWGLDYRWNFGEKHSLRLANQAFFELIPDAGSVRNLTIGELVYRLTQQPALSLVLGAENEYDTDPEPGDGSNDLKYYLNIGLDF